MARVPPLLTTRARAMRKDMSAGEARIWSRLQHSQTGWKFTRQHPVGRYILDFACRSAKLAVEIDGERHAFQADYDAARTRWLESLGWRVIRFSADTALRVPEDVVATIIGVLSDGGTR